MINDYNKNVKEIILKNCDGDEGREPCKYIEIPIVEPQKNSDLDHKIVITKENKIKKVIFFWNCDDVEGRNYDDPIYYDNDNYGEPRDDDDDNKKR